MSKTPLVTISIPVYNGERFLKATIESILAQTYTNIEVYVLDNCSTDATPKIVKSFKDKRLHYVRHKKNIGVANNFTACTRVGTGEYVAIYHADDIYEPTIVEEQVKAFAHHPKVSCIFTNSTTIDASGNVLSHPRIPQHLVNREITFEEALLDLLRTFRSPYCCPSCIAKRSVYRKIKGYDDRFRQVCDVHMYLRLMRHGPAYIIGKRLMRYRHSDTQASIRYSTTHTAPNQLFGALDTIIRQARVTVPDDIRTIYEAYRDWEYTVCAINILAKRTVTQEEKTRSKQYVRRSITLRRLRRAYREPVLLAVTIVMLIVVHIGLGSRMARTINAYRRKRHLEN